MRLMHKIQEKILRVAQTKDISNLSLTELAVLTGTNSAQAVKYHLDQLKEAGFMLDGRSTTIPVGDDLQLVSIPIVGMANAGPASIFADERVEGHLKISTRLLKTAKRDNLYALKVNGTSMNQAKVHGEPINDGDFVIVDSEQDQPVPGDYVVAVVDNLANIKQYHFDPLNSQVALVSESTDDFAPIFLHSEDQPDAVIAGKVVQVLPSPVEVWE